MKTRVLIEKIVYGAIFTSIAIVIKLYVSFDTPLFRLSFYEIPLMFASILLGPIYGVLAGFITDVNYLIINPRGMIVGINWFTLECITLGLLPGLFFYFVKYSQKKLALILLVTMMLGFTFNTLGIRLYWGSQYALASIPLRLLRDAVKYPIYIYLMHKFLMDSRFATFNFVNRFLKKHKLIKQGIINNLE